MEQAELELLAELGLPALLPLERLPTVAAYCWDRGETTGDARYCSLWRTIDVIVEAFEEHDAIETETFDILNYTLKHHLGGVIHAETAETGALLARALREEILSVLRDDRLAGSGG